MNLAQNKKREPGATAWPREIFESIVPHISNADNLVNYLTAMETNVSDDLVCLLHRVRHAKDTEWPVLCITSATVRGPSLQQVVKYYRHIQVTDAGDLSDLEGVSPSTTTIDLRAFPAEDVDAETCTAWYRQLARVPVTHLTWRCDFDEDRDELLGVLPQLSHLRSLRILHETNMAQLFAYVGTSKLTELFTGNFRFSSDDGPDVLDAALTHLTKWLDAQPVTGFGFIFNALERCSPFIAAAFLHALTRATALTTLTAYFLPLAIVRKHASFRLPPMLQCLRVQGLLIDTAADAATLETLVRDSKLTKLAVMNTIIPTLHSLLQHLPWASLTHLALKRIRLSNHDCQTLALCVPLWTALKGLDLHKNAFDCGGVMCLARAMPSTSTLETLGLSANRLSEMAAATLIQVAAQRYPRFCLDLTACVVDTFQQERLKALACRARVDLVL
ncbi:Aste57867_8582 [Aphanomyces stellatus]|uniref:Aste57867_8582 protein n=1 Tax=Aphanomyces stellatus TaxID=120398 RepID=A0A485KKM8_9STRA|nr:hypothetical protein As57867_008550 [Aphanomyces stellatus]VFT85468.1 Aste57867_8582 [Aphanomyces stellatus]